MLGDHTIYTEILMPLLLLFQSPWMAKHQQLQHKLQITTENRWLNTKSNKN